MTPDPEKPPRPGLGIVKKAALAGVLIVLLTAGTVASAALLEVDQLVDIVQREGQAIPGVKNVLDDVPDGGPQTVLVIGSDRRWGQRGVKGLSDTLILVRLDPDRGVTAVMSIPRDLKAQIPLPGGGYGTDKINAAYSMGGPNLTLRTVRNLLGIPINHIVEVNFNGFQRAVNRLGCVYVDVDRRYYHSNEGLAPSAQYAEIDLEPGYQRLCGGDSLDYVRYRHTDSDFVRAARQQDFLRQAKGQFSLSSILGDRKELLRIFSRYTRTDLRSEEPILKFLRLAFEASKNPIRRVDFPATDAGAYVEISASALEETVDDFLNAKESGGAQQTGDKSSAAKKARRKHRKKQAPGLPRGIVPDAKAAQEAAIPAAAKLRLPVYYPAARLAGGRITSGERDYPPVRAYRIRDRAKNRYEAYRMVLFAGVAGQFYGVQGTRWKAPPILDSPSDTMRMRGRTYELFYDGSRLRLVAWRTPRGVYWVSNTLSTTLTNRQMLAIARSLTRVGT